MDVKLCFSYSKKEAEGVWEQGAEENMWTQGCWSGRRVEKNCIGNEELYSLCSFSKYY
jgi:hypothetical protein